MPTHAIGPGTCNLSVNVPVAMRAMIGRVAMSVDKSSGWLVRRMVEFAPRCSTLSREAFLSAKEDARAADLIRTAMRDGLTDEDAPALRAAIQHIERSRKSDVAIARRVAI